jgi:carbon-monoxide dehydrogenase small subunit
MRPISTPTDELEVEIVVNGDSVRRRIPSRLLLSDFLRDELNLTATHVGCEHGICGACTVLFDGRPARSCIALAATADGCEITTLEGLADDRSMQRLQRAFADHHGLQCGYCTPGFLMTLWATDSADLQSDEDIRHAISGNICRCTGYQHIVEAVSAAIQPEHGTALSDRQLV